MVTYYDVDKVKFVCGCYNESPLYFLYICKHCLDLRCKSCISHEVDTFFCRNCVENTATAEAKIRKNRCANCYDCPSCSHVLGIRATVIPTPNPDDPTKTIASKMFYLFCTFCRWTTHDINMEDKTTPTGSWVEPVNPYEEKIQAINEKYQQMAIRERSDREKMKFSKKRSYHSLLTKFPSLSPCFRKSITISNPTEIDKLKQFLETQPDIKIPSLEASEEAEADFDIEKFINGEVKVEDKCDIFQLHQLPYLQPRSVVEMKPRSHRLSEKRSLRCRKCDHNVSKSDYNPNTIKFRINTNAYYNVPEIKIIPPFESNADWESRKEKAPIYSSSALISHSFPNATFGRKHPPVIRRDASFDNTSEVIIMLTNPMEKKTSIILSQMDMVQEHEVFVKKTRKSVTSVDPSMAKKPSESGAGGDQPQETSKEDISLNMSLNSHEENTTTSETTSECNSASMSASESPISTIDLEFPKVPLFVDQKSDAVTLDSRAISTNEKSSEDSTWIVFRKFNSIGIRVKYTPRKLSEERLKELVIESDGEKYLPLKACVNMTYDFFNKARSLMLNPKDNAKTEAENAPAKLTMSVILDIGLMKIS